MLQFVREMEESVKEAQSRIDVFEPRFCALERLEDQYVGWLQQYREEISDRELFIKKMKKLSFADIRSEKVEFFRHQIRKS